MRVECIFSAFLVMCAAALAAPAEADDAADCKKQLAELRIRACTRIIEAKSTTKEVRHIRMSDIWSAPITSGDDLETALERLREAVLAQLDDDTEVRFR